MSTKKFVGILMVLSILTSGLAVFIAGTVLGFNPFEALLRLNLREINTAIKNENYDEAERLYIEKLKQNYDIKLVKGLTEVREMKAIKEDLKEIDELVEKEHLYKGLAIAKEMHINNRIEVLDNKIEEKYEKLKTTKLEESKKELKQEIKDKKFTGDRYNYGESYYLNILYKEFAKEDGVKELIKEYVDERNKWIDGQEAILAEGRRIEEEERLTKLKKQEEERALQNSWDLSLERARDIAQNSYPEFKLIRDGVKNEGIHNPATGEEGNAYNFLFESKELEGKYIVWIFMDESRMARWAYEPLD